MPLHRPSPLVLLPFAFALAAVTACSGTDQPSGTVSPGESERESVSDSVLVDVGFHIVRHDIDPLRTERDVRWYDFESGRHGSARLGFRESLELPRSRQLLVALDQSPRGESDWHYVMVDPLELRMRPSTPTFGVDREVLAVVVPRLRTMEVGTGAAPVRGPVDEPLFVHLDCPELRGALELPRDSLARLEHAFHGLIEGRRESLDLHPTVARHLREALGEGPDAGVRLLLASEGRRAPFRPNATVRLVVPVAYESWAQVTTSTSGALVPFDDIEARHSWDSYDDVVAQRVVGPRMRVDASPDAPDFAGTLEPYDEWTFDSHLEVELDASRVEEVRLTLRPVHMTERERRDSAIGVPDVITAGVESTVVELGAHEDADHILIQTVEFEDHVRHSLRLVERGTARVALENVSEVDTVDDALIIDVEPSCFDGLTRELRPAHEVFVAVSFSQETDRGRRRVHWTIVADRPGRHVVTGLPEGWSAWVFDAHLRATNRAHTPLVRLRRPSEQANHAFGGSGTSVTRVALDSLDR